MRLRLSAASVLALLLFASGCSKKAEAVAEEDPHEAPRRVRTAIGTRYEAYVEHPLLKPDESGEWIVHLTRLRDFKAAQGGFCELIIGSGESAFTYRQETQKSPGIFIVQVKPRDPAATVTLRYVSPDGEERMELPRAEEAPAGTTFTKEQQWMLDFATGHAERRDLAETLRVPGEIRPRSGGVADIVAPVAGRLSMEKALTVGTPVERGAALASVLPPTNAVAELPALELAEAEARAQVEFATRDRERAARLVEAGAAPRRRLEESQLMETAARARLTAAQSRLKQYESSRQAEGEAGARRFFVRSPLSGVVSEVMAAGGGNVEMGAVLLRAVDLNSVYVAAMVPEAELARLKRVRRADVRLPDGRSVSAGRLVSLSEVVDPATRTAPAIYELDNQQRAVAMNQAVEMVFTLSGASAALAVPETAVVDEGASSAIYLLRSGEVFERRAIRTGVRSGGLVAIEGELDLKDRIVTRGAYLLRLASLAGNLPAEGHVH